LRKIALVYKIFFTNKLYLVIYAYKILSLNKFRGELNIAIAAGAVEISPEHKPLKTHKNANHGSTHKPKTRARHDRGPGGPPRPTGAAQRNAPSSKVRLARGLSAPSGGVHPARGLNAPSSKVRPIRGLSAPSGKVRPIRGLSAPSGKVRPARGLNAPSGGVRLARGHLHARLHAPSPAYGHLML
jgi:hypothetical protein